MNNFLYNFWFVQFVGVLAMIFSIFSWNSDQRKNILKLQAANSFLFVIHYYLLGAFAGALMSVIILARNLVFMRKEKKWAAYKIWFYIFLFLSVVGLLFSWKGIITILPAIATIIATYGFYQDRPGKIRSYILTACFLWIPYTIVVHSYSGLVSNIIGAIGIIIGMYRLDRNIEQVDKITTILFDLDGTILDTREAIFQAFAHGLTALGYKVPPREEIFSHVGKEFNEMISGVTGRTEDNEKMRELVREYQLANMHLVTAYTGVVEVLKELQKRGYKLGAVTNARGEGSRKRLEQAGILNLFETLITLDDVENPKPHAEPVLLALKNMNEKPENAIMIGDSHFDIESGKKAGTKTIRVTYGFHTGEMDNPAPDYFIDDIKDLLKLL